MKGEFKVKLEMAKFLQQTLDEMAPQAKGRSSDDAKDFSLFIEKVEYNYKIRCMHLHELHNLFTIIGLQIRTSGAEVTTEEILKFSKLFEDEITLDSLSRPQLLALSRVLEIPAIGTSAMLRFQLRMRLRNLAIDDKVIIHSNICASIIFGV